MPIKVSTVTNDLAKVRVDAIKKLIAGKTNNDLLVMMTGCNDIEILSAIYQATGVSKNVTARARFKLAKIWLEKDNRAAGARKAAEKRKAQKPASEPAEPKEKKPRGRPKKVTAPAVRKETNEGELTVTIAA